MGSHVRWRQTGGCFGEDLADCESQDAAAILPGRLITGACRGRSGPRGGRNGATRLGPTAGAPKTTEAGALETVLAAPDSAARHTRRSARRGVYRRRKRVLGLRRSL